MASSGFTWVSPARPWLKDETRIPTFSEARNSALIAQGAGIAIDASSNRHTSADPQKPRTTTGFRPQRATSTSARSQARSSELFAGTEKASRIECDLELDHASLNMHMPFLRPREPSEIQLGRGVILPKPLVPSLSHLSVTSIADPVAPWKIAAPADPSEAHPKLLKVSPLTPPSYQS